MQRIPQLKPVEENGRTIYVAPDRARQVEPEIPPARLEFYLTSNEKPTISFDLGSITSWMFGLYF